VSENIIVINYGLSRLILQTRNGFSSHFKSVLRPPAGPWRQFRTKPRTKPRSKDEIEALSKPVVEPVEGAAELGPAPGWSALVRPTIFSIAFGGGTVCACAVWQYENMRLQAARGRVQDWWTGMEWGVKKAGGWREELHQWWSKQHEGEKLFWPICFLNVLVFAAWKVPALQGTMLKYFASNPGAKAACLPMLLSAFSHFSAFHLGRLYSGTFLSEVTPLLQILKSFRTPSSSFRTQFSNLRTYFLKIWNTHSKFMAHTFF